MELQIVETKIPEVVQMARGIIEVKSNETEAFAVEYCKILKTAQKQVSETFDPMVEKAHQAHKEATTQRAKFLDPLKAEEKRIKDLIGNYRLELERQRKAEEDRIKAEQERLLAEERKRLLEKAEQESKSGNEEKANDLAFQSATLELGGVAVVSKAVKQTGMAVPMTWKARIVNEALIPRQFLIVNEKALNDFAKTSFGKTPIAGVEFYEEPNVRIRI